MLQISNIGTSFGTMPFLWQNLRITGYVKAQWMCLVSVTFTVVIVTGKFKHMHQAVHATWFRRYLCVKLTNWKETVNLLPVFISDIFKRAKWKFKNRYH